MNKVIQGLENYSYGEIISIIRDYIENCFQDNEYSYGIEIIDIQLHGSRLRGQARRNSGLDAVVQYSGDRRIIFLMIKKVI